MARVPPSLIKSRWRFFALVISFATQVVWMGRVEGTDYTWQQHSGVLPLDWTNTANWGGVGYPNGSADTAFFPGINANTITVNVDQPNLKIKGIEFNYSTGSGYILSGIDANALTFDGGGSTYLHVYNTTTPVIDVPLLLNADLPVGFTTSAALTISKPITETDLVGPYGMSIAGAGTLTLSGSYSGSYTDQGYHGKTTFTGFSNLNAGAADSFSSNSEMQLNTNSTVDLAGYNQTIGSLSGFGLVKLNGATLTVGHDNTTPATSFTGVIGLAGDTGSLKKVGTGTLQLFAFLDPSYYSGGTTISSGTIEVSDAANLGTGDLSFDESGGTLKSSGIINFTHQINLGAVDTTTGTFDTSLGDIHLSGKITGSGNLAKIGTGSTLYLTSTGVSDYSGATLINQGTLFADDTNALSPNSAVTVASGAFLYIQNAKNQEIGSLAGSGTVSLTTATLTTGGDDSSTEFSGTLQGTVSPGLIKKGTGTFTLSGNTTSYFCNTTISKGALELKDITLPGNITIDDVNASLIFDVSGAVTYDHVIDGTGSLVKQNSGTLSLVNDFGQNTYSGGTAINGGVLEIWASQTIGTGTLTFGGSGGTLRNLGGFTFTHQVTLNAPATFDVRNTETLSGKITGSGTLTKIGSDILTLSSIGGINDYSGDTTITTGTLRGGALNALSPSSAVTVTSPGILSLTNGINSYSQIIASLAGSGNVTLGTETLTTGNATDTIFSGVISGSGGLTKQGTDIMTLSGANIYTGATAINNGTIKINIAAALPVTTAVTIDKNLPSLGILDLNNIPTTIGSLADGSHGGGTVNLSATLTTGNASNTTFSGVISGSGGLTKQGTGIMTLSGANSYNGATAINNGTIKINNAAALPVATAVTIDKNLPSLGILDLNNIPTTIGSLADGSHGGGTVNLSATLTTGSLGGSTFSGTMSGSGGLIKEGTSIFTLSGSGLNTYNGDTIINNGTIAAGALNAFSPNSAYTVNSPSHLDLGGFAQVIGSLAGDTTINLNAILTTGSKGDSIFSGALTGTGGITKEGTSTFTLSGSSLNTYNSATTINGGTLLAGAANAFSQNSAVTVNSSGTLATGETAPQKIGSLSGSGSVTLGSTGSAILYTGFDGTSPLLPFSGGITGAGSFVKVGAGTQTLSGTTSNYLGLTVIEQGILSIADAGNLGTGGLGFLASGGTLQTTGAGPVNYGGPISLDAPAIFDIQANTTFTGNITDGPSVAGSFTKNGSAILTLSPTTPGANTYSGATTINGGTLLAGAANAFSQNSAVTVNSSGTLATGETAPQKIGSLSGSGSVTLGSTGSAILYTGFDGTSPLLPFSGGITGAGSFVKVGAGTQTLSGTTSNYSGSTVIEQGTISLADAGNLGTGGLGFLSSGGTLQITGALTYGGPISLGAPAIFDVQANTTFTGSITDGPSVAGSFTKNGGAILTLSASGGNTYSGDTIINAGTLQGGALNAFSPNSAITVSSLATLDLNGNPQVIGSLAGSGTVTLNAILTTGSVGDSTFTGTMGGTGGLTKVGGSTFTLLGSSISYTGPTTINAGTLQLNDTTAFASDVTINSNADLVFDVSDSNIEIYGNLINGSGSVTKQDSGTLRLTNTNNAYTGGTFLGTDTLVGGILEIANGSYINNGPLTFGALGGTLNTTGVASSPDLVTVTLNGPAIFDVDASASTIISGVVSGNGSLTKIGDGTLTLLGTSNSYSGGTFIGTSTDLGGSLIITNDGSLGNAGSRLTFGAMGGTLEITSDTISSRPITLNGAATFVIDTTTTLSGKISGSGSLNKTNTGTLILTGNNTYSGGTSNLGSGTLQGDTNSLPESVFGIYNEGNLIFNQNFDDTYASPITGPGSFFKTGTGALTLSADGNQDGGVTVGQGRLNFQGAFSAIGGFVVQNNATLGVFDLTGNIDVQFGGTLTSAFPGTVTTNMHDEGTLHLESGSDYVVNFDMSTGQVDLLTVSGNVTIDPGVTVSPITSAASLVAFKAPILKTEDSSVIKGTFNSIDNPFPLLDFELIYDPAAPNTNTVYLSLSFVPFTTFVNCGNPGSVAAYFDQQNPPADTDFNYVLSVYRFSMLTNNLFDAFDQLHPALFSAFTLADENSTMRLRDVISDRASELFFTACDCNIRRDFCDGWWMSLLGDVMNQKEVTDGCFDYFPFEAKTGGVVFGTDTIFRTNFTGGICGGFDYTRINWDELDDKGTTYTYFASLYASGCILRTLFDGSIIGAYSRSQADRAIEYLELDRTASHIQNDWFWNVHLGATYPIFFSCFSLSPFALVDYFNEYQEAFKEHGAESLDLEVAPHRSDLLRSEAGLRFSFALNEFKGRLLYEFKRPENLRRGANVRGGKVPCCGTRWIPTLTASYIQEWRFMGTEYTASMPEAIGTFQVLGLNPNRGLISPTAEILILNDPWKWSFSIRYGAEFNKEVLDQNLFCKLSYDF